MLAVQFDITFPGLPCEWISLDAMDISGDMHLDVVRTLPVHRTACTCAEEVLSGNSRQWASLSTRANQ